MNSSMNPRPHLAISYLNPNFRPPAKRRRKERDSDHRYYEVVWPECFFDTTGNAETYAYYIKYVDLNCIHHAHYKIVLCTNVLYKGIWHILHTTI